jgi:hypothetical protein
MNPQNPELEARAKAYRALSEAYNRDPAQALYLDQVRRDTETAHRWWLKQQEQARA